MRSLAVTLMLVTVSLAGAQAQLRLRPLSAPGLVDDHVISGRARCAQSAWLLTDAPALVQVKLSDRQVVVRPIHGFRKDEQPWGLACVHDDTLLTLADYRTLVRLSFGGDVAARIALRQPKLNVFAVGEWLLLQQPPTAGGIALLQMAALANVNRVTPWPGIVAPPHASVRSDLASGMVGCGLPHAMRLPCWLTRESRIAISDGVPSHMTVVDPRFLKGVAVDPNVPLWDVALTASSRVWVLTSAAASADGRHVGGRLTRTGARGDDDGHADLKPRARLILDADERAAIVLTTEGGLMEVAGP